MTNEKLALAIKMFAPEAKEVVEMAMKDLSTKDGYGKVMQIISPFPKDMQKLFLAAMIQQGYPVSTAQYLTEILGL